MLHGSHLLVGGHSTQPHLVLNLISTAEALLQYCQAAVSPISAPLAADWDISLV
jgi:hypothetical protein